MSSDRPSAAVPPVAAPGEPSGLSSTQAAARLARDGPNEVVERRRHPLVAFVSKFWSVSAWMLELIAVLSLALGKLDELAVALALLFVNAVIAFAQEQRASSAVEALRQRMQVMARVLRDGRWQVLAARELVRGDVVRLRAGDFVPADLRLDAGTLRLDSSALTGESREVGAAAGDVVHAGATVRHGEATAQVVATGASTAFGRTVHLVDIARPTLQVERVVARVVRWLFVIVGALVTAVALLGLARGLPLVEIAPLALVLLMSAVPVALPVMFTVSTAVGARQLARRGALVTRLAAVEDAATMDVLCVDKTGTLTLNRLTLADVVPLKGAAANDVLQAGAQASQEADQDPIDLALIAAAGASQAAPRTLAFVPFDPERRRTEAVVEQAGRQWRVMKGAVRTLAMLCELPGDEIDALDAQARAAAAKGLRALAVARGPVDGTPSLLGLVLLQDPPRPDAGQLVGALRERGVAVKMLTGDALPVALEIARDVGLGAVRRMSDLKEGIAASSKADRDPLDGTDGLAEVFPEDKFDVVRGLQQAGHVTGMTGDGVNDAPALRQAEVGIAVAGATDVAKGAASVVLTDPGLANIVPLVDLGRATYQRILTWILNKISRTILKSAYVAVALIATGQFVVSAFAMLLLVFMTDFAKVALATDRVRPSPRPETWAIGGQVRVAAVLGVLMVVEALLLLWAGWTWLGLAGNPGATNTFAFLTLLYFAICSILSLRERRWFGASRPSAPLAAALAADALVGTILSYTGLAGLAPLPAWQTLIIAGGAAVACLGVNDAIKVAMIRRLGHTMAPSL
jgi:plasma-membrane proton-efflux P-type ATPase